MGCSSTSRNIQENFSYLKKVNKLNQKILNEFEDNNSTSQIIGFNSTYKNKYLYAILRDSNCNGELDTPQDTLIVKVLDISNTMHTYYTFSNPAKLESVNISGKNKTTKIISNPDSLDYQKYIEEVTPFLH